MSSPPSERNRTCAESSEGESGGVGARSTGVSYDVEGKFSYSQVGSGDCNRVHLQLHVVAGHAGEAAGEDKYDH